MGHLQVMQLVQPTQGATHFILMVTAALQVTVSCLVAADRVLVRQVLLHPPVPMRAAKRTAHVLRLMATAAQHLQVSRLLVATRLKPCWYRDFVVLVVTLHKSVVTPVSDLCSFAFALIMMFLHISGCASA